MSLFIYLTGGCEDRSFAEQLHRLSITNAAQLKAPPFTAFSIPILQPPIIGSLGNAYLFCIKNLSV